MAKTLNVTVTDYSPEFIRILQSGYTDAMFSNLKAAMNVIAGAYQKTWVSYAYGNLTVPGSKAIHSTGPYARSIQVNDDGPFAKEIFTDYLPHKYIEDGHPEIDLKEGLLHGKSARIGANGPWTVVSFRHYTQSESTWKSSDAGGVTHQRKNVMPANIQSMMRSESEKADTAKAQGLSAAGGTSQVTGKTYTGQTVRHSYVWGARLDSKLQTGRRSKIATGYTWGGKSATGGGKYAGMVRMEARSGQRETRTQYRTFRVVSAKSDPRSWIVPAAPPIPIRQAVMDFVADKVDVAGVITRAIEKDIS